MGVSVGTSVEVGDGKGLLDKGTGVRIGLLTPLFEAAAFLQAVSPQKKTSRQNSLRIPEL
jgi:hypothetical protein